MINTVAQPRDALYVDLFNIRLDQVFHKLGRQDGLHPQTNAVNSGFLATAFALVPTLQFFCKIHEFLLALEEVLCHALKLLSKETFGIDDNNLT